VFKQYEREFDLRQLFILSTVVFKTHAVFPCMELINNVLAGKVFSQRTFERVAGVLHNFLAFAKSRLCKYSAK
jgi:hypothetical protein